MKFVNFNIWSTLSLILLTCEPYDDHQDAVNYILYTSISTDQHAVGSPDGSLVVYFHRDLQSPESDDYPTGLYLINANGTERRLLFKGSHVTPTWSPDGKWIAFSSDGIIQIINSTGDSLRACNLFIDPMFFPDWSPNGAQIIFSTPMGNSGTYISNPSFTEGRKFFDTEGLAAIDPCWSPDNDKVIYTKANANGEELFVIDTATLKETQITKNGNLNRSPDWSPNGLKITWSKSNRIIVMGLDGSNEKFLGIGRFPSWTSNSNSILYSGPNSDLTKEVIWRINIDGSNKAQLTN